MKHVNVLGFEESICVDNFAKGDSCDMWHHELEPLNTKSILASYVDPFLINPSIDKHVISLGDSILNVGMISLHAKLPKLSFVGEFEFFEYVVGNNRVKRSTIVDYLIPWSSLCFYRTMVKPFNGIGMFYGHFVKDFSTHMSLVDCVVINGLRLHCSHICAYVLTLLEQLRGAYFDKNRMILVVAFHKFHIHDVVLILHIVHQGLWIHCSYMFDHFLKLLGQGSEIHCNKLGLLNDNSSCKHDVDCKEPTRYVEQEFVTIWRRSPYLSKNDVSMVDFDLSWYNLENRNFVRRSFFVIFNLAHCEDPFLRTPSTNEDVNYFVNVMLGMGIGRVREFGAKGFKVLDACVSWHDKYFHCMTSNLSMELACFMVTLSKTLHHMILFGTTL